MKVSISNVPKPSLLLPKVTKFVHEGEKIVGENGVAIIVPKGSIICESFSDIGKKGKFQSYLFKNADDKAVQHYTRYITDNGNIKDVVTEFNRDKDIVFNTTRRTILNGRLKEVHNVSILPQQNPYNTDEIIYSKSFMTMTPHGDCGGLELLREGKSPVKISCKYNYEGKPIKIKYKNSQGQNLDLTDTESMYLPFVFRKYGLDGGNDFAQGKRVKQQTRLAQRIQEKLHCIEGILPEAKVVHEKDLHTMKTSGMTLDEYHSQLGAPLVGEAMFNGQINLVNEYNQDGLMILDRIAHECMHEADIIKMLRGGVDARDEALKNIGKSLEERVAEVQHEAVDSTAFENAVISKFGHFKKGTPEYKESVTLWEMNMSMPTVKDFISVEQHDMQGLEGRAIHREKQEMQTFSQIAQKVGNFFTPFLNSKSI